MADPLSIASGTLAVITAAQQTASAIYRFIRDCKEARADLTAVTGELSELTVLLELIRDDNAAATNDCLPDALQYQVRTMLASCTTAVRKIESTLAKCRGKPGPLRWTVLEKDRVVALKGSLEAFKSGLGLALETVNLSITRNINTKTDVIQDTTTEIKRDTHQILEEIYKLRRQLPPDYPSDGERLQLEQWLDNLTHYAESVVDTEEPEEDSDAVTSLEGVVEQAESDDEPASPRSAPVAPDITAVHPTDNSQIPCRILATMPCGSDVIQYGYCTALDIWATLHVDRVLRLWSPQKKELVVSFSVLENKLDQSDLIADSAAIHLTFCPVRPELVLIQVENYRVEVWNWEESYRVSMGADAQTMFSEYSIGSVRFMPQSTLLYAINKKGYLMMVDLNPPRIFRQKELTRLVRRDRTSSSWEGTRCVAVRFISDSELWILWKLSIARRFSFGGLKPPWVAEIVRLSSEFNERPLVSIKYGGYDNADIRGARVTARYRIQREFRDEISVALDVQSRRVLIIDSRAKHGREKPEEIFVLDLDTGTELSRYRYSNRWGLMYPVTAFHFKYVFCTNTESTGVRVICGEDGRCLGTLPFWRACGSLKSGELTMCKQNGVNIEVGVSKVTLDELARTVKV
ncbi:hypothetical protein F5Y10DRAFT_41314 [Nemania abortiva]|nr:hypothetical protein F5Y10DRAFT_41314 [Nemania abortiva]